MNREIAIFLLDSNGLHDENWANTPTRKEYMQKKKERKKERKRKTEEHEHKQKRNHAIPIHQSIKDAISPSNSFAIYKKKIRQVSSSINQIRLRVIPRILIGNLPSRASIELIQDALGHSVEQLLGVDAEEVPGDVEGFVDTACFVRGLADEGAFELVEEFEGELVLGGEGFFSDDCLHGGCFGLVLVMYVLIYVWGLGED